MTARLLFLIVFATLALSGCGPGISSLIDSAMTTGGAGLTEFHKREAEALSRAPCSISMEGLASLSTVKQFAIQMLCRPEAPGPTIPSA